MKNQYNTIVIGAGHSGLLASYYLKKENIDHIIIEKNYAGSSWTEDRWDSFTLITPNWMNNLPGIDVSKYGSNNSLLTGKEISAMIKDFEKSFTPDILENTEVKSVKKSEENFILETTIGEIFTCENIVIATGRYSKAFTPKLSKDIPENVSQFHSADYKNPTMLPEGNVAVVGTGRSGAQIAIELSKYGKEVFLYSGRIKAFPPVIYNTSGVYWLNRLSGYGSDDYVEYTENELQSKSILDKLEISIFNLPKNVHLMGRLTSYEKGILYNDDSLKENIINCMEFSDAFLSRVHNMCESEKTSKSLDDILTYKAVLNFYSENTVDIKEKNITSIIWATGFRMNMDYLDLEGIHKHHGSFLDSKSNSIDNLYFMTSALDPKIGSTSGFSVGLYGATYDAEKLAKVISNESK